MVWWIVALAALGFVDAFYIYYKKKRNEKLVCVLGSDCNKVIRSSYGQFFGVDNTIIGMVYYVAVVGVLLAAPAIGAPWILVVKGLRIIGSAAALASLYLLYVQLMVLREWCDYCLFAAILNIVLGILFFVSLA